VLTDKASGEQFRSPCLEFTDGYGPAKTSGERGVSGIHLDLDAMPYVFIGMDAGDADGLGD
jgi:hypothetical protein